MKKSIRPVAMSLAILVGVGAFALNAFASPLVVICFFGQKRTIQSHLASRYASLDPIGYVNPAPVGACPASSPPP
jgi:hypothetical protein